MKKLMAGVTTALLAVGLAVVGGAAPAVAHQAPEPVDCIGDEAVSYSYDASTNSGVVSVAGSYARGDGQTPSTGELCEPLYVTATSWSFVGQDVWPLALDQVNALPVITAPGDYAFGAPVSCGKGIIYASRAPIATPSDVLVGPDDPYSETWLQDLFEGPDTYTLHDPGCNAPTPVTALAEAVSETCVDETSGDTVSGYIEVAPNPNVSYYIDGAEVTGEFTEIAPGEYTVTASAHEGYVLEGPAEWAVTVTPADCAVIPPPTPEPTPTPTPTPTPETPELPELPELPTFAVFEASASAVAEQCVPGSTAVTSGYIEVVFPEGAEDAVQYFVGDRQLTEIRTELPAGAYTVTANATLPGDAIVGLAEFDLTVAPATDCELPVLAATGVDTAGAGTLAAGLLLIGSAVLLLRRYRTSDV